MKDMLNRHADEGWRWHEAHEESAPQFAAWVQQVPVIQDLHAGRGSVSPPHICGVGAGAQAGCCAQMVAQAPPHWHFVSASKAGTPAGMLVRHWVAQAPV
jgi:hypothetical protein